DAAEACGAIMDVENDEQAEQCRDKESDPKEHDRLGHDATLVTLLDSRSGSTSPPCDLESVLSCRAPDGAAVRCGHRHSVEAITLCAWRRSHQARLWSRSACA